MKLPRIAWLALTLLATAALAAFGDRSAPPLSVSGTPEASPPLPRVRVLTERSMPVMPPGDPFGAATTSPSSAANASAVLPSPSFSPHPRWRVIGKQADEAGGWTVFLAQGDATRVVRAGDALDDDFRVTAIHPPRMTLQHLRQKTRLTLDIGEAKE